MPKLEQAIRQYLKRKGNVNYGRLCNFFERNQESYRRKRYRKGSKWFIKAFAISMLELFENNEIVFVCEYGYHSRLACWGCEVYYIEKNQNKNL